MHLPTLVVQILFIVQLPVCLYGGYRTARRTGRSMLIWLVLGFLAAIAFPPVGAIIIFVAFFFCPPARGHDSHESTGETAAGPQTGDRPDGAGDAAGDAPLRGAAR
jgi:hypothetical protein